MASFYPAIKQYITNLFACPQSYTPQVLSLFHIPPHVADPLSSHYAHCQPRGARNGLFINVEVFKYLWVKDHFIFYIRATLAHNRAQTVFYKRYRQFHELHRLLQQQADGAKLRLPALPKRHAFGAKAAEGRRA